MKSKKADMTIPIIIGIVIALVVAAIMLFAFRHRAGSLTEGCEQTYCKENANECSQIQGGTYIHGPVPCRYDDSGERKRGRCCIREDFG